MKAKRLVGPEGRSALYAMAALTGEVVLALGGDREDLRALAAAGASRSGHARPPAVVIIKDPAAFAASADRLSWKRVPSQILVDASGISPELVERVAAAFSAVAPVVVAISDTSQEPAEGPHEPA